MKPGKTQLADLEYRTTMLPVSETTPLTLRAPATSLLTSSLQTAFPLYTMVSSSTWVETSSPTSTVEHCGSLDSTRMHPSTSSLLL